MIDDLGEGSHLEIPVGAGGPHDYALALGAIAASSYYGKDVVDFLEPPPACPTILHFGDKDRLIPLSDVETIRRLRPECPAYVYDAGHGFDGNNPAAAEVGRARTMELFRKHIG